MFYKEDLIRKELESKKYTIQKHLELRERSVQFSLTVARQARLMLSIIEDLVKVNTKYGIIRF
jgi:hypothetical protein